MGVLSAFWKKMTEVCVGQSRTKPPLRKDQQSLLARTVPMHLVPELSGASLAVIRADEEPSSLIQPEKVYMVVLLRS